MHCHPVLATTDSDWMANTNSQIPSYPQGPAQLAVRSWLGPEIISLSNANTMIVTMTTSIAVASLPDIVAHWIMR